MTSKTANWIPLDSVFHDLFNNAITESKSHWRQCYRHPKNLKEPSTTTVWRWWWIVNLRHLMATSRLSRGFWHWLLCLRYFLVPVIAPLDRSRQKDSKGACGNYWVDFTFSGNFGPRRSLLVFFFHFVVMKFKYLL